MKTLITFVDTVLFGPKILIPVIKIFLAGLLVHFFLHTFFTFQLGLTGPFWSVIWAWKEIIVLYFFGGYCRLRFRLSDTLSRRHKRGELVLLLLLGVSFVLSVIINEQSISTYLIALRYDFLGFMIVIMMATVGKQLSDSQRYGIVVWYLRLIMWALVGGLLWYLIIVSKPGVLNYFGYDRGIVEGVVGERPPSTYFTQYTYGLVRNQFLFERPIHWGFFLTALRPVFFMVFLYKRSFDATWPWWLLFAFNIFSTFSRASRGAWFIQLLILGVVVFIKQFRRFFLFLIVPFLVVVGLTKLFAREHIVARTFSNTGHIELLVQGRNLFIQKLWTGWGAGFAGPASFHVLAEGFNPENQFLQIGIEFGLVGMMLWIIFWLGLVFVGPWLWYQTGRHYSLPKNFYRLYNNSKKSDHVYLWLLAAMGCGFVALTISGLVLHSYVDRMIVYPTALLTGLLCSFLSGSTNKSGS